MKKKSTTDEQAEMFSGTSTAASSMLAPIDVQNKEFRVSRMGGYRMRDVDEFLDQVTEAMGALIAENERLRAAATGTPLREVERAAVAGGTRAPGDAGAVQAFLTQERDFLRSLGSLVQDHTEQMKGMARGARQAAVGSPTVAGPAGDRPEPAIERGPDPEATEAMSREELEEAGARPIRVEEPEPAATGRPDQGRPEGSLRELFWGEEG